LSYISTVLLYSHSFCADYEYICAILSPYLLLTYSLPPPSYSIRRRSEVAKKKIKVGYGTEANEYVLKKYKIAFYASLLHGNIASML